MEGKWVRINVRLEGETASRFLRIRELLGLKNDTEIVRSLINWYWREHREELQPRFEHFNLNANGVLILDREANRVIQVYFRPTGILCEYCQTDGCVHIQFALTQPTIQEMVQKKRREGWKLPG